MKFLRWVMVLACLSGLSGQALARAAEPLVNIENASIAEVNSKPLSLSQIETVLLRAGAQRGWSVRKEGPGKALATLNVRDKHSIVVAVIYTPGSMSFRYVDSDNMKFGTNSDGQRVIHPFYMKWVNTFFSDIKAELGRL